MNKILTGVISAVITVAVIFGVLLACGVIKTSETTKGTKLPICYPDKTLNWVLVNDNKTMRASFDDVLTLDKDKHLFYMFEINNVGASNMRNTLVFDKESKDTLSYDVWASTTEYFSFSVEDKCYNLTIKLYNNATLTEAGEITAGDGFVFEVGNFQTVTTDADTGEEVYTDTEIESFKLLSLYQASDNNKLLQ